MKKIEAIIQPHKLDQVKEALLAAGVEGITISEVRGHGRQKGHTEVYRGAEYKVDLLPKVKLETVVVNSRAEQVVNILAEAARSGKSATARSSSVRSTRLSESATGSAEKPRFSESIRVKTGACATAVNTVHAPS